jgi:glycine betaine/proline transport system ATP-binding protein
MTQLVGLAGWERHYPKQLSGGMQQRVGLARALAVDPAILLFDEPFSALDPLIRREMQDELIRLQRVVHKTIVFITHDFAEALRLGDRIAIMRDGRFVQVGTPQELVMNPANEYVGAFTRDAPRSKVLTAASVAQPFDSGRPSASMGAATPVASSTPLEDCIPRVAGSDQPIAVVDDEQRLVGYLDQAVVLRALAG